MWEDLPAPELPTPVPDDPDLLYFFHQIVRFHPVDDFEGYAPGETAEALEALDGALSQIVVVDTGDHLEFTMSVAAALLDDSAPAPFGVDVASDLPSSDTPAVPEDVVLNALAGLSAEMDSNADPNQKVFVVLPFGTYNCGAAPSDLLEVLAGFPSYVHFIVSAGNDETSQPSFPAAFTAADYTTGQTGDLHERVTSVGSVGSDGTTRSCFSNFNPSANSEQPQWIDFWQSGEEVPGSRSKAGGGTENGEWSGTSFAAPQQAAQMAAMPEVTPIADPDPQPTRTAVLTLADPAQPGQTQQVETQTFCPAGSDYLRYEQNSP